MLSSFATKVTTKTIKMDASIAKLNPINEAIKNAIDAKAENINIYLDNCNSDALIGEGISIIIEDDGNGFNCLDNKYMNARWTHYKGGDYEPNTLGGRSRGRYSYLKFIDYNEDNIENIKLYTKIDNKNYSITFCIDKENIIFKVSEEQAKYKNNSMTTQLNITKLGENFIKGRNIEDLSNHFKKEIIIEFADKILKCISISINGKKINVEDYIEDREKKNYKLSNQEEFSADMIIWNNEIDLVDKKHTFLFNTSGNSLGKINSGSAKSVFNCHSVFLTSDIFTNDYELMELNIEDKKIIDEVQETYKPDLDKLLFNILLKNKDIMADKLAQKNRLFDRVDDMVKEKIREAYKVLAIPLMFNKQNINKKNMSYFSNSLMGIISDKHSHTLTNLELVFNLNENQESQEILSYVNQNIDILSLVKKYNDIITKLDFLHHFENLVLNEGKDNTKERTELHKIIENNLWIFGEDYSDLDFFSDQSLKGIFNEIGLQIEYNNQDELKKIPDIFIPRTKDNKLILIELKAPKVEISQTILSEVLNKYILNVIKILQKQDNTIKFIESICVSSMKQEHIANLDGDNFIIKAMTWKEIIDARKKENKEIIEDIKKELSLSKYKSMEDFKEKEINKDKSKYLKKASHS